MCHSLFSVPVVQVSILFFFFFKLHWFFGAAHGLSLVGEQR